MLTLFAYKVSPYAAKVRAILRYKGLAFDEKTVDPTDRRELKRLSGQIAVPVIQDGERVVADSTAIARYLDEKYPQKPILPADPALRARALLFEEWADEGLPRVVQPVRWLIPENAKRSVALMRSAYPDGAFHDAKFAVVARVLLWDMRRKYAPRPPAQPNAAKILNRLADAMDILDGALAETGWLAGPAPSVADFAAWGFLNFLEALDGWETVKTRRRVAKLVKALAGAKRRRPTTPRTPSSSRPVGTARRRSGCPWSAVNPGGK
jgi:glutathione S-transferase